MVSLKQGSLQSADQLYHPEFCKFFANRCVAPLVCMREKYWRLACHGSQGERTMYLVPHVTPSYWKVEASCGSFQVTSAYSSLLLMEQGVCPVKAHYLFASHCPCFAFQALSLSSVILPFISTLESVQPAAEGRHLPILILCGTVSKLTDGAISSICSVNSSWVDAMWMEPSA